MNNTKKNNENTEIGCLIIVGMIAEYAIIIECFNASTLNTYYLSIPIATLITIISRKILSKVKNETTKTILNGIICIQIACIIWAIPCIIILHITYHIETSNLPQKLSEDIHNTFQKAKEYFQKVSDYSK